MKRLLMTTVLTCALTCTVLAGEMPTVGSSPSPAPAGTQATLLGEIPTGGQISNAVLTFIQTVVGLLT